MSIERSILEKEYYENTKALEYFRSIGQHRLQSSSLPFKEPYHSYAGEIFWFEWRNRRLKTLLDAWFIIEDRGINCHITLKAITPIRENNIYMRDLNGLYIRDSDLDAAAQVAMLIN